MIRFPPWYPCACFAAFLFCRQSALGPASLPGYLVDFFPAWRQLGYEVFRNAPPDPPLFSAKSPLAWSAPWTSLVNMDKLNYCSSFHYHFTPNYYTCSQKLFPHETHEWNTKVEFVCADRCASIACAISSILCNTTFSNLSSNAFTDWARGPIWSKSICLQRVSSFARRPEIFYFLIKLNPFLIYLLFG